MDGRDERIFETSSVYNAAALVAAGFPRLGARLARGDWVVFDFADPDGATAAAARTIKTYTFPPVQPQSYIDALSALRSEVRRVKADAGCWVERRPPVPR